MFNFSIDSIRFSGKDNIELETNSLTILTGPNSAGKSTALREILSILKSIDPIPQHLKHRLRVVDSIDRTTTGSVEDFSKWISNSYPSLVDEIGREKYFTTGKVIHTHELSKAYNNPEQYIHFYCSLLDTKSRLSITDPKSSISSFYDTPTEFIHFLQVDSKLSNEISEEIKSAFGKDLIINWGAGRQVWFHVGQEPKGENKVSPDYLRKLSGLPRLDKEGNGIQSFTGCLLAVKCGAHKVLLIDEPEAFLHPSQARRLGAILAKSAKKLKRQIIIATHSSEIIQGALTSGGKVSVCRITKTGSENHVSILKSKELKQLWSKPLLQSSSAIDGVFHRGVIICEAESDCRFYESILRNIELNKSMDLHFVQGGGKGEISTLAKSYKALNIKCVAIADFDILRNRAEFKKLYEILGGDFSDIEKEYKSCSAALKDQQAIMSVKDFVQEMNEIIPNIESEGKISNNHKKRISSFLSQSATWSRAKRFGVDSLKGEVRVNCKTILEKSQLLGLFIVPKGELESWWLDGSSDKNQWILEALEEIRANYNTFEEADLFLKKICKYFEL